jgi:hypothetical protein
MCLESNGWNMAQSVETMEAVKAFKASKRAKTESSSDHVMNVDVKMASQIAPEIDDAAVQDNLSCVHSLISYCFQQESYARWLERPGMRGYDIGWHMADGARVNLTPRSSHALEQHLGATLTVLHHRPLQTPPLHSPFAA